MPPLRIALDIDDTITHAPEFFALLTHALEDHAEFHIVTARHELGRTETECELADYGIRYDHIAFTFDKADYIRTHNITVFFEDTDEYFLDLPEHVHVFKAREPGNFDFDRRKWIYGEKTGYSIDG